MKNRLLALSIAALTVWFANAVFAQSESNETAETEAAVEITENDKGVRFELDFDDDELSTDEKFDIASKAIKEAVGDELSKDIELEIDGLSDEEKAEIVTALEKGFTLDTDNDGLPWGVVAIAVPAVVLTLGMPVIIVLLVLWFGHRKRRQKMEMINAYIEANQEVPEQVLNTFENTPSGSLRSGLMLTAVGVGILAAFSAMGDSDVGALGLIPLFIGVARLVYWYVEERKA